MHGTDGEFLKDISTLLGAYYLAACGMNLVAAWCAWRRGKSRRRAMAWLAFGVGFGAMAGLAFLGLPLEMPQALKSAIDAVLGPVVFSLGSLAVLTALYLGRRFFVIPAVAWTALNASLLFMGASMTDPQFAVIVTRPDNVPIVAMVYLLGFFTWLAAAQAVRNDDRLARGEDPVEKEFSDPVLVWPDLVYIELICMVILTVVLVVWSVGLRAPLEQPANPVVTPNPSKAPWYFLGLQEMLVFFDPAIAGVILPGLIILGLMAIPYLDFNREGSGYYTIRQRRFAYLVFQFGFLQLWILLILIGTFMRGPNWNFFGLYEPRDPYKVLALNNVKLSEYFWVMWLGRGVPQVPAGSGTLAQLVHVVWREIAGVAALTGYFVLLPAVMARTILREFRRRMGLGRYAIMTMLLLMMLSLPLKMLLRWTSNLSYVVSFPEYFFNF
jgi:hypothetical protein